jgi:uncharacterized membrane protein YoaK (UPF0700 family)
MTLQETPAAMTPQLFYGLSNNAVALMLTFIGGYVNTVGYTKLFSLFSASVTGNLIVATASVFRSSNDVLARLLITLFFTVGAFVTTLVALRIKYKYKASIWDVALISLAQVVVFMSIATAVGLVLDHDTASFQTVNSWQCVVVASLLAFAMGMHCAAAMEMIKNCPNTTGMTANVIRAGVAMAGTLEAAMHITKSRKKFNEAYAKMVISLLVLFVFVVGALAGAIVGISIGFWGLLAPIAIVLCIMLSVYVAKRKHLRAHTRGDTRGTPVSTSQPSSEPPSEPTMGDVEIGNLQPERVSHPENNV